MEKQYYISIKEKLFKSEIYDKVKNYIKQKINYEARDLYSKILKFENNK